MGGFYIRPMQKNDTLPDKFCRGRVARPESRSDFSVYENADPKTKIITKRPYFQRVYPMKIGTFVYCEIPCGNCVTEIIPNSSGNALRRGTGNPPPTVIVGKRQLGNGRI